MSSEDRSGQEKISRRDFLGLLAIGTSVAAMAMSVIGLLKFMKPALLPDVPSTFKIGRPGEILPNSTKLYPEQRVLVVRRTEGVAAISLVCPHLGCVVQPKDQGFSCPCHGSTFDSQGLVLTGPSPKALPWYEISPHPSGKLVVDKNREVPSGTVFSI